MDSRPCLAAALAVAALAPSAWAATFEGRRCPAPSGYRLTDCRVAEHGTPDLSRRAWRALRGAEESINEEVRNLAVNPQASGARSWPLIDSLGQPMGRLVSYGRGAFALQGTDGGVPHAARAVRLRGRGCAASPRQRRRFPLVQVIARRRPPGGTQAFIDGAALRASRSGRAALRAFRHQAGGGTGCGPRTRERRRVRPLADPRVGATAHARLSSGELNSVDEYDAKPAFGNVVYFSTNTTEVRNGGIARGMVRVGTPVAPADGFASCDPNSDGTLTWRYWSIHTADPRHPRLYGWIPARCPREAAASSTAACKRISSASRSACARYPGSPITASTPSRIAAAEGDWTAIPAPTAATHAALMGWSANRGATTSGRPAASAPRVEPEPPWQTTAAASRSTSACGTSARRAGSAARAAAR